MLPIDEEEDCSSLVHLVDLAIRSTAHQYSVALSSFLSTLMSSRPNNSLGCLVLKSVGWFSAVAFLPLLVLRHFLLGRGVARVSARRAGAVSRATLFRG